MHVSASQITTFLDCPRKWYFDKVVGLERKVNESAELGSAVHELLEKYIRGELSEMPDTQAGRIAKQGLHRLTIKKPLAVELSLEDLPIKDSPCEVKGFIDVLDYMNDEIIDHKTTKSRRWTKTPSELAVNTQMIIYAKAYLDNNPEVNKVTLTHLYYGTKDEFSEKVSVEVSRAHVTNQWNYLKKIIKEMMQASSLSDAGACTASYEACDKYGGCPFRTQCQHAKDYTPKQRKERKLMPKQENRGPRILFIDCLPLKGAVSPTPVSIAYKNEVDELLKVFKVPHLGLVEYGKGWSALACRALEEGWKEGQGPLYIDSSTKESEHLTSILLNLADIVVRGV